MSGSFGLGRARTHSCSHATSFCNSVAFALAKETLTDRQHAHESHEAIHSGVARSAERRREPSLVSTGGPNDTSPRGFRGQDQRNWLAFLPTHTLFIGATIFIELPKATTRALVRVRDPRVQFGILQTVHATFISETAPRQGFSAVQKHSRTIYLQFHKFHLGPRKPSLSAGFVSLAGFCSLNKGVVQQLLPMQARSRFEDSGIQRLSHNQIGRSEPLRPAFL